MIPAIDIIEGKCVRLQQGDYNTRKVYCEDPLEMAMAFQDAGIKKLHLVDLDGAREKKIVNIHVLEKLVQNTILEIDFGGGIREEDDLEKIFEAGASQVTIGSIAVKEPDKFMHWIERFGPDKIILGADVKNYRVAVGGWKDVTSVDLFSFISRQTDHGVRNVMCTDISKDGMLQGTSVELYKSLRERFPDIYLIASGGVTSMNDIYNLSKIKMDAVIVGKAIYEERISLNDLKKVLI
ncbi:MAG: 1-(5-phosphoribosyl)-5-[(5-phosphoribosylamino)methylideneamino]imidazole-4-carboxamide isomerase [bacterium]